jgi:hypothetical protein
MPGAGIALTGIAGIVAKVTPGQRLLTAAAIISDRNLAAPPCKKAGGLLRQKEDPRILVAIQSWNLTLR